MTPPVDDDGITLTGRCHCGTLSLVFNATRPVSELGARACTCSFCRARRLRWTSDPNGSVKISIAHEPDLSRYRFGTNTADALICRRCGCVLAVVSHDEPSRAVINLDVLDQAASFGEAMPVDLEGEEVSDRLARRRGAWTPASVDSATRPT